MKVKFILSPEIPALPYQFSHGPDYQQHRSALMITSTKVSTLLLYASINLSFQTYWTD